MKIINFPETTEFSDKPKAIALGSFKSIHLGHRKVFEELVKAKKENPELEIGALVFDDKEVDWIYNFEERMAFLKEYNLDFVWKFELKKENFGMHAVLFEKLLLDNNFTTIVSGDDFSYGRGKSGHIDYLTDLFNVRIVKRDDKSTTEVYKSTREGEMIRFKELMGHYFFYKGEVVRGEGNGKKFGMPTANVNYPKGRLAVKEGIYYSYLIYDGKRMPSLTSISTNPTLKADKVTYETFIYDFDKDIYGQEVYVELIEKFRDPIAFESIDKLIEQLEQDKITGRKYFKI